MKKIFSIVLMSLVLLSCGNKESGSESEYELKFIGLDETEQELFKAECPFNEEVYLAAGVNQYKIVPNSNIFVYKVDSDSMITSDDRLWGPNYWATLVNLSGSEEILDNFRNSELEEYTILGLPVIGAVSVYDDNLFAYLWFKNDPDERAYFISQGKKHIDDYIASQPDLFTEDLASGTEYANYLLYSFYNISLGCNNFLTMFTSELSNGTKVRVAFVEYGVK